MTKPECQCPVGAKMSFFGIEVDPHRYEEIETHTNVTVRVLRCKECGHEEIEWERTPETVSKYGEDVEEE